LAQPNEIIACDGRSPPEGKNHIRNLDGLCLYLKLLEQKMLRLIETLLGQSQQINSWTETQRPLTSHHLKGLGKVCATGEFARNEMSPYELLT